MRGVADITMTRTTWKRSSATRVSCSTGMRPGPHLTAKDLAAVRRGANPRATACARSSGLETRLVVKAGRRDVHPDPGLWGDKEMVVKLAKAVRDKSSASARGSRDVGHHRRHRRHRGRAQARRGGHRACARRRGTRGKSRGSQARFMLRPMRADAAEPRAPAPTQTYVRSARRGPQGP